MTAYLLKRLVIAAITLVVASIVVFAVLEVLPGDPARLMLGMNASADQVALLRNQMGLDAPLILRYLHWVGGLLTLDFGRSYTYSVPVIDLVREIVPPFNPEAAVMEFASTVRQYGLSMVIGDNYGAVWVKDAFMRAGVYYHPSDRAKSALYLDALAAFNARKVALLDHLKTVNQFAALERRATRGGRDTVDHPRGAHDDIANSVAGVIANLSRQVREEAQKVDVSKPQPDQAWVLPVAPDVYPSRTSRLRV